MEQKILIRTNKLLQKSKKAESLKYQKNCGHGWSRCGLFTLAVQPLAVAKSKTIITNNYRRMEDLPKAKISSTNKFTKSEINKKENRKKTNFSAKQPKLAQWLS